MTAEPAGSGSQPGRVLLVDGGKTHDVFEVLELAEGSARVRTAFLFELGEDLRLRIEEAGGTFEVAARVVAHTGPADDKTTELELFERTAV